jgi:hypothetical protein
LIIHLNVNCKIIKLTEGNTGENTQILGLFADFLEFTWKTEARKRNFGKLYFIKKKKTAKKPFFL